MLRAAALLGVDFELPDLAAVLGRDVPDLLPPLEEARAAGVLAESDGILGFRHPLIRAALYDEMPATVRAAWHRDAAHALADASAPPERVARQLLRAAEGPGAAEAVDERMLDWLVRTGDHLVSQAPGVAAELFTQAASSTPFGAPRHGWLVSRLADALYRSGDIAEAARVASQALAYITDPDLLVDLHWTLAQCRMGTGQSAESLATLDRALETPGLSARHRARLLVVAARTHSVFGEVETAGLVAADALAAASEAGDTWAMGWALHVLTLVTTVQGQLAQALPLFDRALEVTQADSSLTDLRLLLQINQAVTLGYLDQYERAFLAARAARDIASQVGTPIRLAQVHGALGQLLFETGQWDEALAEVQRPENLQEPGAVCTDLGIAAVIEFHRGEIPQARRHLEAALPYAERLGHRLIPPLALARSLDHEHAGSQPDAFAALMDAFDGNTEEIELEYLLADAFRLAARTGDLEAAKSLAGQAAKLAKGSEIPHRQANALYCEGLLDHDAGRLLTAAERYQDASRPLPAAKAYEAAAAEFLRADDRSRAREAFGQAVEAYTSLGASVDVARLGAAFRAHGIHLGPRARQSGRHRLGQPHRYRSQGRPAGGRGAVEPGDRRQAHAFPDDRVHPRLAHPDEAGRRLADRHRPRIGPARHPAHLMARCGSQAAGAPAAAARPGAPEPPGHGEQPRPLPDTGFRDPAIISHRGHQPGRSPACRVKARMPGMLWPYARHRRARCAYAVLVVPVRRLLGFVPCLQRLRLPRWSAATMSWPCSLGFCGRPFAAAGVPC